MFLNGYIVSFNLIHCFCFSCKKKKIEHKFQMFKDGRNNVTYIKYNVLTTYKARQEKCTGLVRYYLTLFEWLRCENIIYPH